MRLNKKDHKYCNFSFKIALFIPVIFQAKFFMIPFFILM